MILPTKHIHTERSLLAFAAKILKAIDRPKTVSELWHGIRSGERHVSFSRFVMALDFLYILGSVEFHEGLLKRGTD